jgi:hypothetical protein
MVNVPFMPGLMLGMGLIVSRARAEDQRGATPSVKPWAVVPILASLRRRVVHASPKSCLGASPYSDRASLVHASWISVGR